MSKIYARFALKTYRPKQITMMETYICKEQSNLDTHKKKLLMLTKM